MASCYKCDKPVYFAERIVALGKEWHRICFTCTECNKILQPGRHCEHKGLPYCEIPCYSNRFGPTVYRLGYNRFDIPDRSRNKSVILCEAFQEIVTVSGSEMTHNLLERPEMEAKLASYNDYFSETSKLQISTKEVNNKVVMEGQLRVHWGTWRPIRFQQKDEPTDSAKYRHSGYCFAISNDVNGDCTSPLTSETLNAVIHSPANDNSLEHENSEPLTSGVVMRKRVRKRRSVKRLSIINGHLYDAETSIFVPSYGSVTTVTVTSHDTCSQVIKLLLDKFKVENFPDEYCLCVVKCSGETYSLGDNDLPLIERIFLGPLEDDAKIFIVERHQYLDITEEVAHFVNLPYAVLNGFLEKCNQDEEKELQWIKEKFNIRREALQHRLAELTSHHLAGCHSESLC